MLEIRYLKRNGFINLFTALLICWVGAEYLNLFLIAIAIPVVYTGLRDLAAAMNLENWKEDQDERK